VEQYRASDGVKRASASVMPLTITDFAGFEPEVARRYAAAFDSGTRERGRMYYNSGAVRTLKCNAPGRSYSARVEGNFSYDVGLRYEGQWAAECTCPVGVECKHIYAAVQKLLEVHAGLTGTGAGKPAGKNPSPAAPEVPAAGFAAVVREKLGRKLERDELRYLKNIHECITSMS
jgi:hypothetical protein